MEINKPLYVEGYNLKSDEFLLKISDDSGFLTKFNKDGSIPINFKNWKPYTKIPLPIYIHTEKFSKGWNIYSYRSGKSQDWAELIHPEGFILEIYLSNLFELMESTTIINGELIGEFKWEKHTLIKKDGN